MKYSFLILIAIYAIFHVVQRMIQESAKKKNQQQAQRPELEQGLPRGGQPLPPRAGSVPELQSGAGPGGNPGRRLEDLVARRLGQLEQLRGRRQGRGGQPGQVRVGGPPVATAPQPLARPAAPPKRTRTIATLAPDLVDARRQEPAPRRQQPRRAAPPPSAVRRPQWPPEAARDEPVAAVMPEEVAAHPRTEVRPPQRRARQLWSRLDNPGSLRDLFILKEMLDLPVSMRSSEVWDRV